MSSTLTIIPKAGALKPATIAIGTYLILLAFLLGIAYQRKFLANG